MDGRPLRRRGPLLAALPALLLCGLGLGSVVAPLVNVVLAGIKGQDAGSASGVLTTVQQIGGAVGVAVIGVFFFGPAGRRGGRRRAPRSPARTQGAGSRRRPPSRRLPDLLRGPANAKDPSAVPAAPRPRPRPRAGRARPGRGAAADTARRQNFSEAFQRTLLFEVAVFLACFLLVFPAPDPARGRPARRGGGRLDPVQAGQLVGVSRTLAAALSVIVSGRLDPGWG